MHSGCAQDCTLDEVRPLELELRVRDGSEIVEVAWKSSTDRGELGPFVCERSAADDIHCDRLFVSTDANSRQDFDLTVEVASPAFVPITATYAIESDGCHPITQQDSLVLDWRPLVEICTPFCENAMGCESDVPWASVAECTDACRADVADPPPDACVSLYRGLYGCLGAGTCEDYLAYRDEQPGHRCEAHLDAINECESLW